MGKVRISVIISVRNAQKSIAKCLDSIFGVDYDNFEVIVVDDGSNDGTAQILKEFLPKIKVVTNLVSHGPSAARNAAGLIASGELLAFTDADCLVHRQWLNELERCFVEYPLSVSAGGCQLLPIDAGSFQKKVQRLFEKSAGMTDYIKSGSGMRLVHHNPSCNSIYKRDAFLREGGFLEGLWPGEDVELDLRLRRKGYLIVFNPKAIVYHYRQESMKAFQRMMFRYGNAQGFLVRRYGFFRAIHFFPIVIFTGIIILLFVAINRPMALLLCGIAGMVGAGIFFSFDLRLIFLAASGCVAWSAGFSRGFVKKDAQVN